MGIEKGFKKVKLFCGVIYNKNKIEKKKIIDLLENNFSKIDFQSQEIQFDITDYYNEEMGKELFKFFVSFEKLILPQELPDIKLKTNRLEIDFSINKKRIINLDPGYISEANVIIATTKNYYHRVPLDKGIYAHMEYVIKKKKITPLEWTYPDFKTKEYINIFTKLREIYKNNLKNDI